MQYDSIIPIGANCRVAQALRDLNLRQQALPVDWVLSSAQALLQLIKNDFNHFFEQKYCQGMSFFSTKGKKCTCVLNHFYQISFIHDKAWHHERFLTYNKRIQAFKDTINQDKVLLIRWDMKAPFHNDHNHIEHEQRDKEYFQQSDSLENLYQLKDICNQKYKGDVDLLILHADKIAEEDKRPDVFYHFIDVTKVKQQTRAWDRIAIRKALKSLKLTLKNNNNKISYFQKLKIWMY
ncbi:DUF1796 family putative cysteine peptidase [Thalassotalea sp. PLHSN55]|uniref:DUF1796 family putative cysteine peptidase n=1 Tax=Thalassotalea sp. PLHSN55 TaxID=3435888 RepID=UPI003F874359